MAIGLDEMVVRAADLVSSQLDGETVLMSVDQGKYFGLDRVGSLIWDLIDQPRTVGQICDLLMARFRVDRATCERDVTEFLEELQARSMLGRVDGSAENHA
jgi:hypothetical protein